MSEEFSTFFEDAVRLLSVEPDEYFLSDTKNLSNPVDIAIRKFENHPSVQAIKQNISVNKDFYFSNTEVSDILKETTALNNKKNGTFGNIPTKLLKEVSDICAPALNDIWNNEIITQKCFPNNLKLADVTPVFKKEDASLLKNYRPVSVLPVVSKIYERIMQKQILEYIDKHLFPHLYKRVQYTNGSNILYNFSNRKQRIKINFVFSSWKDLILSVPQGSALGAFLFNIYLMIYSSS